MIINVKNVILLPMIVHLAKGLIDQQNLIVYVTQAFMIIMCQIAFNVSINVLPVII